MCRHSRATYFYLPEVPSVRFRRCGAERSFPAVDRRSVAVMRHSSITERIASASSSLPNTPRRADDLH